MNIKKISIIILIAAIFLAGYRFVSYKQMEKELDLYEVEFLSCFGDISCDVNDENYLTLGLVVRTKLNNINKIIEQLNDSGELKFDNDAILIKDYKFVGGKTKDKNVKYLTLNIIFNINNSDSMNEFEAKKIFFGKNPYEIGSLFFIPTEFVNSGELDVRSTSAICLGRGLEDYYVVLDNKGEETLEVDSIDTRRFENHISKILVGRDENVIETKAPNFSFVLKEKEKDVEVTVCFDPANLSDYDVFYFSPSLVYHSLNGEQHRLDLNYYISGLMISEDDLEQMHLSQ
ncbi:hypothetical protein [Anaerotignum sp.]|uniref:hypothetical protein n=1 Tax=Anaerotignum sp. TaxID=2039241 RepID=UPI002714D070|nr:hypothetical protein [Anaerotignum sp.]